MPQIPRQVQGDADVLEGEGMTDQPQKEYIITESMIVQAENRCTNDYGDCIAEDVFVTMRSRPASPQPALDVLDVLLGDLSRRSCIGRAIEIIDEERGRGWLRNQLIEAIHRQQQQEQHP